ncbi:ribose-phosphate diphosphokinase [Massilia sp. SYSU DXS3249]
MLFALGSSQAFGERVAAQLGVALAPLEEQEFEDGEHKARPLASVRGSDVFVLHSLFGEARQSANDKMCRLLFFIGALVDAGAARVTALVPYLAYARKDRRTRPRDPVSTRYVAALFEAVGTDAVVTADVHNVAAFQNAFRCGAENLSTAGLFADHFAPQLAQGEIAVVAPDAGAIKRAEGIRRRLERALGRPVGMAIAEKYRSGGVVSGALLVGDVRDRDVLIVDDLISSGTTLARAAAACRGQGARRVFAAVTHGLFTGGAPALLAGAHLDRLVVSDSAWPFAGSPGLGPGQVEVLSCTGLYAQAIRCIHEGGSIAELIEG